MATLIYVFGAKNMAKQYLKSLHTRMQTILQHQTLRLGGISPLENMNGSEWNSESLRTILYKL